MDKQPTTGETNTNKWFDLSKQSKPSATAVSTDPKKNYSTAITAVSVFILALTVAIIAIVLYSEIGSLKIQVQKLQQCNTKGHIANGLNAVLYSTASQLDDLQSSVDTLATARDTAMTQLSSLQSSVDTLTTRVDSPVNLYQSCIQETTSCKISTDTTTDYWMFCWTPFLRGNITGFNTIIKRCEYESDFGYFVAPVLRNTRGQIQCRCDVTRPSSQHSPGHEALPANFIATCSVTVIRCPDKLKVL